MRLCCSCDHLHAIWTLPHGDGDFSTRWARIKRSFIGAWFAGGGWEGGVSDSRRRNRRRGVWQRRFWEHVIRDEESEKTFNKDEQDGQDKYESLNDNQLSNDGNGAIQGTRICDARCLRISTACLASSIFRNPQHPAASRVCKRDRRRKTLPGAGIRR
jgi:hypothetical protein